MTAGASGLMSGSSVLTQHSLAASGTQHKLILIHQTLLGLLHIIKQLTLHTHVYNNSNYRFSIKLHFQCNSRQCVSEKEVAHLQT